MAELMSDFRKLSGPQKAAVMMLGLDQESCGKLFSMLAMDEIKELSASMSQLGGVSSDLVEQLFLHFAEQISGSGSVTGSYDSTERLLRGSLDPDRANEIMEELRGPAGRTMWDKLGNVNEQVLANYLKNEYPQTVSVVLSKVRPEHASRVLSLLPEDFATEVVMRMLRMETVQKEILDDVELTLRTEFMSNLAHSTRRDPHEQMADIFNNFDRAAEARFMQALEERDRESSEHIKSLMFTFEDLNRLDPTGIQVLMRHVDKDKLAVALKGGSEELRNLFFSNMSERAAKILREDMDAMGPVRLSDVDEAQGAIVNQAKELEASGELMLGGAGSEDELVY